MRKVLVFLCLILLAGHAPAGFKESFIPNSSGKLESIALTEPIQHGSTVYFVHEFPSYIERYDLAGEAWLEDINLNDIPTAFHVDDGGMYIGFGRRVSFIETDGTERHLANSNADISQIVSDDAWLFLLHGSDLAIVNKFTGARISDSGLWYPTGLSILQSKHRIYARTSGLSPSDIMYFEYDPVTGEVSGDHGSPYHGAYPSASQTYIEPGELRVFDNSGTGYFAEDLTYAGSLGNSFEDILFYESNFIVRRGQMLVAYSEHLRETGVHELTNESAGIAVYGDFIFSFFDSAPSWAIEKVNVANLNPKEPGEPLDPHGLDYPITEIEQGLDGTLYLLSSELFSIFRWSPITQDYLETIPLVANAKYMAYTEQENALILAYADTKITKLGLTSLEEEHLFNASQEPCGLAMAGEFIFLCDPSGAWESHYTFTLDGQPVDQQEWRSYSREFVWNAVNRRMYHFRDGTSPNDIIMEEIDEDGMIGPDQDSPYHSSQGIQIPIRVAPNGSYLVLGSGRIYDADNLNQVNSLSNNITDATWINDQMITLWDRTEHTEIQVWDNRLAVERAGGFIGDPVRLFAHDGSLITVSTVDNIPWLAKWNADLSQSDLAASLSSTVNTTPEGASIVYDLTVSNRGVGEATNADVLLSLPEMVHSPVWTCEGNERASCEGGPFAAELSGQFNIPYGGELHFSLNALLQDELIDVAPESTARLEYAQDPQTDNNVAVFLNDTLLSRSKTGTWYAPARDGEGFVIEVTELDDRLIAVISWYTYVGGEQAWLIGSTDFQQGSSMVEIPVIRTEGADFGDAFDPNEVVSHDAGSVTLTFTQEKEINVQYQTIDGSGEINVQRLDEALSNTSAPSEDKLTKHHSGAWHDYAKPGEGLLISVTGDGSQKTLVVSWFTYLDGHQKWMIGSASFSGTVQQLTLPLITTTGAFFGNSFSSDDVVYEDWGSGTFTLTGCMEATFSYDGIDGQGELSMTKSVESIFPGFCIDGQAD